MNTSKTLRLVLAAGLITCVLGGCGHYTVQKTPTWQLQAQEAVTQQMLAMNDGGHVLAASDSLGYQVFGPESVRSQYAMLRGANEAFARAEAEAQQQIAPTDQTVPTGGTTATAVATVDPQNEQ